VQLRRGDGSTFWAMASTAPIFDDDGTYRGAVALVTDITERRQREADLRGAELQRAHHEAELERVRLEVELNQTRRLESLGRLSAGIAHDFNNLVGVILNYAAAAAKELDATTAAMDDIAHIQQAAEQAADITRKLLSFGRTDPIHGKIFDLNQLIESVAELVGRSFGDQITIKTQLAPNGCFIDCDRSQVEQMLFNLLVNARDALTPGGTITVATRLEETTRPGSASTDFDAVLSVDDDGTGMSPDVLERAFEPFFTTKPPERGTGLGLATVHSIATRANGDVSIQSKPGVGTTVRVRLPATPNPPTS
jgi:signal transduction histidine kinase